MVYIAKRYLSTSKIIALAFVVLIIFLAAGGGLYLMYMNKADARASLALADAKIEREAIETVELTLAQKTDYGDAVLNVLCDADGAEKLGVSDAGSSEVSSQASRRNDHFELETDTEINFVVVEDFSNTAREDMLSGAYKYNLYAADATDAMLPLVSSGSLRDVSDSAITNVAGYNPEITEKLAYFGRKMFIASSIIDVRSDAFVIGYVRDAAKGLSVNGKTLVSLVLDGEFTYENYLAALKSGEVRHAYDGGDVYPLYFGASGGFANFDSGSLAVTPYAESKSAITALDSFLSDAAVTTDAEDTSADFAVVHLGQLDSLRSPDADIGLLPIPKASASAEHYSYIDFEGATMLAMPDGLSNTTSLDILLSRYMELSQIYMDKHFDDCITAGNADDAAMLDIVTDSLDCDYAVLFGYGDIRETISESLDNTDLFAINYYNRKELIEKAFSIIEKRITE